MTDVLALEWRSGNYRDRIPSSLITNYLRLQGRSVVHGSVFNGFNLIDRYRPRVVFQSNSIGALINHQLTQYAHARGVACFSGYSEGAFVVAQLEQMMYGHNRKRVFVEEALFQWSERTRTLSIEKNPALARQIKVSGAPGFDQYRMFRGTPRQEILKRFGKERFQRVIGVACWNFEAYHKNGAGYFDKHGNRLTVLDEYFNEDRIRFRDTLKEIILANPDVLFVIRQHPAVLHPSTPLEVSLWSSGIEGLPSYENVLLVRSELGIADTISLTDFWLAYESTTALEAWLLGKQTCLLNPLGGIWPVQEAIARDLFHIGSPIYSSQAELQGAIDTFYSGQPLPGFLERKEQREQAIRTIIQWDDGLNHVRAGNVILDYLERAVPAFRGRPLPFDILMVSLYYKSTWALGTLLRAIGRPFVDVSRIKNSLQVRNFLTDEVESI